MCDVLVGQLVIDWRLEEDLFYEICVAFHVS